MLTISERNVVFMRLTNCWLTCFDKPNANMGTCTKLVLHVALVCLRNCSNHNSVIVPVRRRYMCSILTGCWHLADVCLTKNKLYLVRYQSYVATWNLKICAHMCYVRNVMKYVAWIWTEFAASQDFEKQDQNVNRLKRQCVMCDITAVQNIVGVMCGAAE